MTMTVTVVLFWRHDSSLNHLVWKIKQRKLCVWQQTSHCLVAKGVCLQYLIYTCPSASVSLLQCGTQAALCCTCYANIYCQTKDSNALHLHVDECVRCRLHTKPIVPPVHHLSAVAPSWDWPIWQQRSCSDRTRLNNECADLKMAAVKSTQHQRIQLWSAFFKLLQAPACILVPLSWVSFLNERCFAYICGTSAVLLISFYSKDESPQLSACTTSAQI